MMKSVLDESFRKYGRVLSLDTAEFVAVMEKRKETEKDTVVYEPSLPSLENLSVAGILQKEVYGEMPIEFGHCSGFNQKLNAVEYHRSSEVDIAATDLVLMLGCQQDIDYGKLTYDTGKIECFFVPKGTAVELYATTLHYAPCGMDGQEFRCGVVLPKGTNTDLKYKSDAKGENSMLFAVNKWLLAHEESGLRESGAIIGLNGKNLQV